MDALREHVVKSLKSGQAFIAYKEALKDVKPELRGMRPNEAIHSVYEELEHIRRAQKDLLDFALDPDWKPTEWPAGFWPEEGHMPTEEEWKNTLNGFLKDQRRAVKFAENEDIDLLSLVPQTENTYLRELMIIIEHNAYHFGKILDIRKSLGDWK
jgi:hypothetical protein